MSILEDRRKLFAAKARPSRKPGSKMPWVLGGALIALVAGYLSITSHERSAARQAELDRARSEKERMDKGVRVLLADPEREAIVKQAGEKRQARLADFGSKNIPFHDCTRCSGNGWVKVLIEVSGYERNTGRTLECRDCQGGGVVETRSCPSCGNKKTNCDVCRGRSNR